MPQCWYTSWRRHWISKVLLNCHSFFLSRSKGTFRQWLIEFNLHLVNQNSGVSIVKQKILETIPFFFKAAFSILNWIRLILIDHDGSGLLWKASLRETLPVWRRHHRLDPSGESHFLLPLPQVRASSTFYKFFLIVTFQQCFGSVLVSIRIRIEQFSFIGTDIKKLI